MSEFVGEFAHEKLDMLIKKVNQKKRLKEDEYKRLKEEVNLVGDDFIREKLNERLDERMPNEFALIQERKRLQDRIGQIDAVLVKEKKADDPNKI
jgi:hypothetical protein